MKKRYSADATSRTRRFVFANATTKGPVKWQPYSHKYTLGLVLRSLKKLLYALTRFMIPRLMRQRFFLSHALYELFLLLPTTQVGWME